MRICVPVPDRTDTGAAAPVKRLVGAVGVIDNSKPRFDVLARAAIDALAAFGFTHADEDYVRKTSPTRPAEPGELERLSKGTVAVLIGSGD